MHCFICTSLTPSLIFTSRASTFAVVIPRGCSIPSTLPGGRCLSRRLPPQYSMGWGSTLDIRFFHSSGGWKPKIRVQTAVFPRCPDMAFLHHLYMERKTETETERGRERYLSSSYKATGPIGLGPRAYERTRSFCKLRCRRHTRLYTCQVLQRDNSPFLKVILHLWVL